MTLGARLAAAREARGVSLDDLARRTRIPLSGLRALEGDAHHRLPPPIFARGYIRACAAEVGLEPDALIAQFDAERPAPSPAVAPASAEPAHEAFASLPFSRATPLVSIAGAAALIALVIWSGREEAHVSGAVQPPGLAAPAAMPAPVGTTGEAIAPARAPAGVSVVLTADRECWVAASADGRRALYRLMQAGEREGVQARERIALRVGDAGALSLSVNGGAPQLAGADGAVRTIVLTAGERPDDPAAAAPRQGN